MSKVDSDFYCVCFELFLREFKFAWTWIHFCFSFEQFQKVLNDLIKPDHCLLCTYNFILLSRALAGGCGWWETENRWGVGGGKYFYSCFCKVNKELIAELLKRRLHTVEGFTVRKKTICFQNQAKSDGTTHVFYFTAIFVTLLLLSMVFTFSQIFSPFSPK